MRRSIPVTLVFALIVAVAAFNYFGLQAKMRAVISADARNEGVRVWVHHRYYVDPATIVYDIRGLDGDRSMLDVFRVFLQFAERASGRHLDRVYLCCKGKPKFFIDGDYFRELGQEYSTQNPIYTSRTFPGHLRRPDGSQAYSDWTGGWLGVLSQQMQDFNDFHLEWYLRDLAASL